MSGRLRSLPSLCGPGTRREGQREPDLEKPRAEVRSNEKVTTKTWTRQMYMTRDRDYIKVSFKKNKIK